MDILKIILLAVLVNNIVLTRFLGICPFINTSNSISASLRLGGAMLFIMVLANIASYFIQEYVLNVFHIEFLQTITFILVIVILAQAIEIILKKNLPVLYQASGFCLSCVTVSCAVLGVALLAANNNPPLNLVQSIIYAGSSALGYTLICVIMTGISEQLEHKNIPKTMKGIPIILITLGLLSLAFMGFLGIIK